MAIVVYISLNESFNPFTVAVSAGGRGSRGPRGSQGRPLRSRRRRARRTIAGRLLTASGTQVIDLSAGQILAMLPGLARTAAEVEADLRARVVQLRDLGIGWDLIGAALQLGEDEVRQRFEAEPGQ